MVVGVNGRVPWALTLLLAVVAFCLGFSLAMALIGDSPWEEFWLRVARCCR